MALHKIAASTFMAMLIAFPAAAGTESLTIPVTLSEAFEEPLDGRLLVFARKVDPGKSANSVDTSVFAPTSTWVTGRDVEDLAPGMAVVLDDEADAFPAPFSALPAGTYEFQAVLDSDLDYNLFGRGAGDLISNVVPARMPGPLPALVLKDRLPEQDQNAGLANLSAEDRADFEAALARTELVDFVSPSLSAFRGEEVRLRGWMALPPDYDPDAPTTYPTVYEIRGFGSNLSSLKSMAASTTFRMNRGTMPPMIWVVLDHATPTGYHGFADSVNNGPWGSALTTELIPFLEKRYHMDARPEGRFLTGHSSGGWSSLWLQSRYPGLFGGAWATSPDPVDFRQFINVDLYSNDNFYLGKDGKLLALIRSEGRVVSTISDFARLEEVLGRSGGQMSSLEWVFSPRGSYGRPLPLFDRATGTIDPVVARYWRDHYDIARRLIRTWPSAAERLDGKFHVIVGTADTFYLDRSVRRLQEVLDGLGAKSSFRYLPNKTHFDLYQRGSDYNALKNDIAWEIYEKARPDGLRSPQRSSR